MIQIIEANIKYLNSINLRLPSALLKLAKVLSSAGDAFTGKRPAGAPDQPACGMRVLRDS